MKALKNNIERYIIRFPGKRKVRDVRDYILPKRGKKKARIGEVDRVAYDL